MPSTNGSDFTLHTHKENTNNAIILILDVIISINSDKDFVYKKDYRRTKSTKYNSRISILIDVNSKFVLLEILLTNLIKRLISINTILYFNQTIFSQY